MYSFIKTCEQIVDLVTKYTNEVTLAIGDGANDVPMLNKASIGVGTLGFKELQAFNASDYSIAQVNIFFIHTFFFFCRYLPLARLTTNESNIFFFYIPIYKLCIKKDINGFSSSIYQSYCLCTELGIMKGCLR